MASADIPSFDLYTCEVCLENMLNKNPRLLSCHHSFCTDCLRKIMKNGSIHCPTCRKETVVENNDVNLLIANFMLQKMKEHMDKIHSSKTLLCQLCLSESASLKCQECLQLLCGDCKHQHDKIKTFKNHQICKLCNKHKEGLITHVCVKCVQPACAKCVIKEHAECDNDVKPYDEGTEQLTMKLTECEGEIDNMIQSVNRFEEEHEKKMEIIASAMGKIDDIKQYYMEKLREADTKMEILNQSRVEGEIIIQTFKMKVKEMTKMKPIIQKRMAEIQNGVFDNFIEVQERVEKISTEVNPILNFNLPDVKIEDPKRGKQLNLISAKQKMIYIQKPVFVKEIRCPKKETWGPTWNISSTNNDYILICDTSKPYITCAFSSDKPTTTIPAVHGEVRDACVYQGYLYTAYRDCVSKRTYNNCNTGEEEMLKPNIKDIHTIVVNDIYIYLLSKNEKRVVKFNLNTNTTREVVSNFKIPSNLNVIQNDGCVKYCVSCYETHSVMVYDDTWNLLFRLGGFGSGDGLLNSPWGVTCTTEGILVADQINNRISQFSFEGTFMKHILTKKDGIGHPLGITFNGQNLWMTQSVPYTVKCFKICE